MPEIGGSQPGAPLLVGYDGSRNSLAALGWALREAAQTSAPVRVVYVYEWGIPTGPVPAAASWPEQSARREAEATVEEAVARARIRRPAVTLSGSVVDGGVVSSLRQLAEECRLLIIGDRGLGGFLTLRAGSVATDLAAFAPCPVVIVRGSAPPGQPVVVGLDDSPDSEQAVRFAFQEASIRGVGLLAVRACQPPPVAHRPDSPPPEYPSRDHQARQQRLAERVLKDLPRRYPRVRSSVQLLPGRPADGLITASRQAQLVVVGAQGQRGVPGLPLGPTAGHLIQHAYCPVAIIRSSYAPARFRLAQRSVEVGIG